MVTDILPNGCRIEYHLSHETYSRIHVFDNENQPLFDFTFEPWQMMMAEKLVNTLRTVAEPRLYLRRRSA